MTIRIKLSKKLVLTSDSRQFVLNKRTIAKEDKYNSNGDLIVKKGGDILHPIAHYSTLANVLENIPDRVIMNSDITSIRQMIKIYKKTIDKVLHEKIPKQNEKSTKKMKVKVVSKEEDIIIKRKSKIKRRKRCK